MRPPKRIRLGLPQKPHGRARGLLRRLTWQEREELESIRASGDWAQYMNFWLPRIYTRRIADAVVASSVIFGSLR